MQGMMSMLCRAANKGIGYEIARQLAKEGLKTVVTARNRESYSEQPPL